MTERPKVHDWKSCVGKLTEGSNPSLSAMFVPKRGLAPGGHRGPGAVDLNGTHRHHFVD